MPPGRPKKFIECDALDAALEVFWDKGFEATSMADLVAAMGIGRQSLYNAFGDKRQLFHAALSRYLDARMAALTDKLRGPGRARDHLLDLFQAWHDQNTSCQRGCMLTNSLAEFGAQDAELDALHRRHLGTLGDTIEDALRRAQTEGDLAASADPRALAHTLLAISQGVATLGKGGVDREYIENVTRTAASLIA